MRFNFTLTSQYVAIGIFSRGIYRIFIKYYINLVLSRAPLIAAFKKITYLWASNDSYSDICQ